MWVLFLGCVFFRGLVQRRLNNTKVMKAHSSVAMRLAGGGQWGGGDLLSEIHGSPAFQPPPPEPKLLPRALTLGLPPSLFCVLSPVPWVYCYMREITWGPGHRDLMSPLLRTTDILGASDSRTLQYPKPAPYSPNPTPLILLQPKGKPEKETHKTHGH